MRIRSVATAVAVAAPLLVASAQAAPISFVATNGSNLAARATFDVVAGNLTVLLENIGGDVLVPADVLTGLFFDIAGVGTLGTVSAVLGTGSTVVDDPDGQPAGGVVGGEWAYKDGIGAPLGATEGIGSAGYGLFGPGDLFPGVDLDSPASPNGMNYGLLSAADNGATGNAAVTGGEPFIKSSVLFTLSGIGVNFDPAAAGVISKVSFQYGTALTEPNLPGCVLGTPGCDSPDLPDVPEPTTMLLVGSGLAAAIRARRASARK